MGQWKIEIKGAGTHDNGKAGDADAIARLLVAQLAAHGQNVDGARFVLTDYTGKEHESTDLLVDAPDAELRPDRAAPDQIMQFFTSAHLPPGLAPFGHLARWIAEAIPRNAERTVALRELLSAASAAGRARCAK